MFIGEPRKNFYSLALSIFSLRMYNGASDATTGKFVLASFTELVTKSFPERLQFVINTS